MWPIIDGHFLGKGVDISGLDLNRFVSVIENFYIEDQIRHIDDLEHQSKEKERLRVEFIKYNRSSKGSVMGEEDEFYPQHLEEPTNDGFFPGLEDGFLGEL